MKLQLKAAWIADLLVNADKQGRELLHNVKADTYCCLGRLAVVAGYDPYEVIDESYDNDGCNLRVDNGSESLSLWMLKEVGLNDVTEGKLIGKNDDDEWSFPQIAEWIRENVE